MVMEGDLTWGGKYTQYTDDVLHNCTWNLHNFINQYHFNKLNKKF